MGTIADDLLALDRLRERGSLSAMEFAEAKSRLLGGGGAGLGGQRLAERDVSRAVEQLDREWKLEREQYVIRGRYGHGSLPSKDSASVAANLAGLAFAGLFLVFWTVSAASMGAPLFFVLFGCAGLVMLVLGGLQTLRNAQRYFAAEEEYQRKRAALLAEER